MDNKEDKQTPRPRAKRYEAKVAVKGTLEDMIKAAVKPKPKKKKDDKDKEQD